MAVMSLGAIRMLTHFSNTYINIWPWIGLIFIETDKENNHVHQFIKQIFNLQYIQMNRTITFVCLKEVNAPFNELRNTEVKTFG